MEKIDQTIFGMPEGNCFAACVASILEQPLITMPDHRNLDNEAWWQVWYDWLRPRNYNLMNFKAGGEWTPLGYSIAGVQSPRGDWLHAVVALDGKPVHDPHPARDSLTAEIKEYTMLYQLNPALKTLWFDDYSYMVL